ncbi:MAG: glycosyltransferase family 2 protein [Aliishimia sp.]
MSNQRLRLVAHDSPPQRVGAPSLRDMRKLGYILVEMGAISDADLTHALAQQRRIDAPLGDILISEGFITHAQLQEALADQHGLNRVDLDTDPPDSRVAHLLPGTLCVNHGVMPWLQLDDMLMVATSRPDRFDDLIAAAPKYGLTLLPVLADMDQIHPYICLAYGSALARRAELRVDEDLSCRTWTRFSNERLRLAGCVSAALVLLAVLAPQLLTMLLVGLSCLTLTFAMALKISAAIAEVLGQSGAAQIRSVPLPAVMRMPKVSVMVPLLREKEIAKDLIRRLSLLTYPKSQLDIVLVLEEEDHVTRAMLAQTVLPTWMRVIEVPSGDGLLTKPRALNYALDFCHGSLIGIWDAEDAPAQDQLEEVVTRFHAAPENVACLQGRLDYYNPKHNWLARCFTIEYATWWRLIMPGLARLGCVIPLGGTTLFFRRDILEELGGWDAHNVTEDADLGLRLARKGYRTELIDTTTYEEANCRAWPWVKQRSRWLKGFAITWLVHMRDPIQLYRDLGFYRFAALQVFFVTALSQFLLAPVFWSFWFLMFTGIHPTSSWGILPVLLGCFILAEFATLCLHMTAVRAPQHRHLMRWTPSMILYFPLGTLAMYKALYELIVRPFYWDKTQHGVSRKPSGLAHDE